MLSQDVYYMYVYEVYYSKNIFYDKDLGGDREYIGVAIDTDQSVAIH